MKKGITLLLIIICVAIIALLLIFTQPKQNLKVSQQVSLVLQEKVLDFACVPDIGNFGSRREYYEIWKDPKNNPYIIHTETHICAKHPPEQMDCNTTITKHFDISLSKEISGIVQEGNMQSCSGTDFSSYSFCNNTASTCLIIEKQPSSP